MFKDVDWFYSKVKSIPIWGKIAIGILVIGLWLIGQLAFRNSMMEIQESSAFISASAIAVGNKEVREVVGENV